MSYEETKTEQPDNVGVRSSDLLCDPHNEDAQPLITEIVQKRDGHERVSYRRPYGSDDAKRMIRHVDSLNARKCGSIYFYRHVGRAT